MKILISRKEYFDRIFQISKSVIPALLKDETSATLKNDTRRESITFLSVMIAKALMKEIGYTPNKPVDSSTRNIPVPTEIRPGPDQEAAHSSSKSMEIDLQDEGSADLTLDKNK